MEEPIGKEDEISILEQEEEENNFKFANNYCMQRAMIPLVKIACSIIQDLTTIDILDENVSRYHIWFAASIWFVFFLACLNA